ncbi:hypothetical protein LCGC14_2071870 [marine sediment metagenome]|uniref:Uncharacterized protein n=1 Tax=marine sediment metagenome TaxID=412755 RepID=A0A0F9EIB6_9ZZZZ
MDIIIKHTPGEWTMNEMSGSSIDICGDNVWIGCIHGDHCVSGERATTGFPGNKEAVANARLVSASPELLKICEEAIDRCKCKDKDVVMPPCEFCENANNLICKIIGAKT